MMHLLCIPVMLLGMSVVGAVSDTGSQTPSTLFGELFSSIDSIPPAISRHAPNRAPSLKQIDSATQQIMDKNRQIQGILMIDGSGMVVSNYDRIRKSVAMGNVASKKWFTAAKDGGAPVFGGVVRADANYCFLKCFPFTLTTGKKSSDGVLVVLVDATRFLDQFKLQFGYPFAVTYKSVPFYHSSAETTGLSVHAAISGYDDLTVAYRTRTGAAPVDTPHPAASAALFSLPLLLACLGVTLLLCLVSYMLGCYVQKQATNRKFLDMEYEKILEEQQKQIHERALSQVYCEIKRQIETHEIQKIEDEIRQKIGLDIEARLLVN